MARQMAEQQANFIPDPVREMLQGLTFNYGDEAMARGAQFGTAARNLINQAQGKPTVMTGQQAYDAVMKAENKHLDDFEGAHPYASAALQFTGGLPYLFIPGAEGAEGARGAAFVGQVGRQMAREAVHGAVAGAGKGQDAGERLKNAGIGAASSAVAEGVMGNIGALKDAAIGNLPRRVGADTSKDAAARTAALLRNPALTSGAGQGASATGAELAPLLRGQAALRRATNEDVSPFEANMTKLGAEALKSGVEDGVETALDADPKQPAGAKPTGITIEVGGQAWQSYRRPDGTTFVVPAAGR